MTYSAQLLRDFTSPSDQGTPTNCLLYGTTHGILFASGGVGHYQHFAAILPVDDTLDFPAEGDVRAGVDYDGDAMTGTLEVPSEADVKLDVSYGANGTEYTGALAAGAAGGNCCF